MLMKRIVSTFLVILMLLGSMSLAISAAEAAVEDATSQPVYEYNTNRIKPTIDYFSGKTYNEKGELTEEVVDTQEEKLATMDLRLEQNGFRMYVDEYSGEVAVENITTGDVLFTNPYDTSSNATLTNEQKAEYLSQIIIAYEDTSNNNQPGTYSSYQHAVKGGDFKNTSASQINVRYIKNGVRIEYSIGRVDTRYLVPERISKDKFEEQILNIAIEAGCSQFEERQLKSFFELKDLEAHISKFKDEEKKAEQKEDFLKKYPMAEKGPVYVFTGATKKEYKAIESVIKKYCPDYTYEELDAEHLALNYTPTDKNEALFKVALEYTIDSKGLSVRLPANGIRFDESIYRLEYIEILPHMGAGKNPNSGYTFFPDGSGALFDFEELAKKKTTTYFYGDVYGDDFAYYNIGTGSPHNEVVRYPVYGLKEDVVAADGTERSRGFTAIIEEGDAMMMLYARHSPHYNSVVMQVNPRPYDEYELSSAISVAGDAVWTVVSPRKYTGDFTVRYIMLTDPDVATGDGYYDTSYVGMAKAYREYLVANGVLTRLTADDIKENIPLYIETFGAMETTEKFLSVPYQTMKALTSFDDIRKMYDELSAENITNINFVLTGYTKGGLNIDQVPYNLNWDGSVEKEMKFEELVEYAKEKGFGVYPDFDFVFSSSNKSFDGLSLKKHAVMTIDGRYTSKREYSATRQTYVSYFELAMSPAYFSHFYEHFTEKYLKSEPIGISVSTLGKYLNSDFDEDEPYHREDSKEFTMQAFAYLDEHYSKVMTSGGNAYTWKYVDYITDIATDSSRHARSSATVPFLGIVLHGYVQTAGEAINMEGNIDYAILRSIENGAALKFLLSYQNTALLKQYEDTSVYYSVRYDIWKSDLIERYNEINAVLKGVQLSTIEKHEFIDGVRVPNTDEVVGDSEKALLEALQKEIEDAATEKETLRVKLQAIRKNIYDAEKYLPTALDETDTASLKSIYNAAIASKKPALDKAITDIAAREEALEKAAEKMLADTNEKTIAAYEQATLVYGVAVRALQTAYNDYMVAVTPALQLGADYVGKFELSNNNFAMLEEYQAYPQSIIDELDAKRTALLPLYNDVKAFVDQMNADVAAQLAALSGYAEIIVPKEEEVEETEQFDKYSAATNSIVLETYENGTSFVLNFNNYAVKVKIGEVYYTVDAYGYIVIS